jgi:DNA polymerase III epsilon subunit-like protein
MLRPGLANSPDALCAALGITAAGRDLLGACLDAATLAEVFLRMTA